MFKTKAERHQEAEGKKSKKNPFSKELADLQTFNDVIAVIAMNRSKEPKEFVVAFHGFILVINPSTDNSEYVFKSKDGVWKYRVEIDIGEIAESDNKKQTKAAKGVATEKCRIEGIRMWSPCADPIIGCSAGEFNEKEQSKPETMQSLFDQMDLNKPRTFVLKNIYNKAFNKYEMTAVFCE
jgi:hypothetical protein